MLLYTCNQLKGSYTYEIIKLDYACCCLCCYSFMGYLTLGGIVMISFDDILLKLDQYGLASKNQIDQINQAHIKQDLQAYNQAVDKLASVDLIAWALLKEFE